MKDIDLVTKKPTEEIVLETKCSETVETLKTEPAVILSKRIDNEITRATEAEKDLGSKIDAETSRATAREDELESQIKQSGKVDDVLVDDVSVLGEDKIARIDLTPYAKESDLTSEISRAKESESSLDASISEVKHDLISEAIRAAYLTASKGQTIVCGFKIKDIISPTAIDTGYVAQSETSPLPYRDWIVEWAQAIIDNIDDVWANGFEKIGEFGDDKDACVEYFQEIIDNIDDCTVSMLNTVFKKFVKHWDILRLYPGTLQIITECFTFNPNVFSYKHFTGKSTGDYINRIDFGSSYYIDWGGIFGVKFEYVDRDGTETDIIVPIDEFASGDFFFEIINTSERAYTPEIHFDSLSIDKTYGLTDEKYSILSNTGYSSVNLVIGTGASKPALTFHRAFNFGNLHIFTHIQQDENDDYYHTYTLWVNNRKAHFTEGALPTRDELLSEISTREDADKTLQTNIDNEVVARQSADATLQTNIDDITALIPSQATSDNQLADKDYVNSSIATSTATFRGTVSTIEKLRALTGDLNDYAYVEVKDSTTGLVLRYDRYKYSDVVSSETGNWAFEYTLNNSSFTSDQWKAITSGITSDLVAQITTNKEAITQETTRATTKETELENAIKEAGKIDDVKVNDVSVVTDKVANIDLTSYAKTSDLESYVKKTGDTMTGTLNVPEINSNTLNTKVAINTGTNANSYFQAQKFRGQGNASTYNHAIDFGYAGHDRVDFYEYGGVYNFWQNQGSTKLEGDGNRVASLQLGKLLERGYTLTYPGKSGTFALTSDFADYATIAYVDEKTALPKISISKSQFESSTSIKLTDEQNAILIDTNNDAVLVEWEDITNYPKIVLHRQISSPWLLLFTSIWNAEMLTLENGVGRLKRYSVATSINDGVQPTYPTASIIDLDTIDFPTITLASSQVTSVSEDGNGMTLKLTNDQYNILCDSLYRAVKIDASGIGLWNDGVIYKLNDDSTEPVYTFFSVSSSDAGIGRIFVKSGGTANVYITYAVSQDDYSKHIHDSVVSNGDGTYMLVFGAPGTGD